MGQAPPSKTCNFAGTGTPFVKAGEFGQVRPLLREWTTSPLKLAKRTDVLLCVVGATCGKINLGEDCAIGRSVAAIRPDPKRLDQHYLHYFLMTLVEHLRGGSVGAAQTVISREMIHSLRIPLPPLPEQRRIVAILDEAFEAIATAKANTEKNLANAREVFERHRQLRFMSVHGVWPTRQIGELTEVQSGGTPLVSTKEFWEGDIPWYSSGELNNRLTSVPERFITAAGLAGSNAKLFPAGSLLVGMYDTAALKMSILDRDGAFNQAIAGIRASHSLLPAFAMHAINAKKAAILDQRRGVRQKNLSLGKIRGIEVPAPSIDEQRGLVDSLLAMEDEVTALASVNQRKLTALDELRQSLLHQAFTGALTAKSTDKQLAEAA